MKKRLDGPPLTVRLPAETVDAIARIAEAEERDISWVHRKLIHEALAARGIVTAPPPAQVARPPDTPREAVPVSRRTTPTAPAKR